MAIRITNIEQISCICNVCGKKWDSRVHDPKACVRCKSYRWNVPKVKKGGGDDKGEGAHQV